LAFSIDGSIKECQLATMYNLQQKGQKACLGQKSQQVKASRVRVVKVQATAQVGAKLDDIRGEAVKRGEHVRFM
jgi:hypothetical protein